MKRKLLYTITLIALVAILATFFKFGYDIWADYFNHKTTPLTYEIQIGTVEDDELPGFLDNGTNFENHKQLKVMAIFNSHKDLIGQEVAVKEFILK